MSSTEEKTGSKNTFQRIIEEERSKIPSKFQANKVLFTWESDDRFAYKFTGNQKSTYALIVVAIGLYFVWVGQPLITITVMAVFFLLYLLYTLPPARTTHNIELAGIRTGGILYVWDDLINFWVADREGRMVAYVNTRLNMPSRLILILESFADAQNFVDFTVQKISYSPLIQPQGYFDKVFDGEYLEASTFIPELEGPPLYGTTVREAAVQQKVNSQDIITNEAPIQKPRNKKAAA